MSQATWRREQRAPDSNLSQQANVAVALMLQTTDLHQFFFTLKTTKLTVPLSSTVTRKA